jgi:hypothetical protein
MHSPRKELCLPTIDDIAHSASTTKIQQSVSGGSKKAGFRITDLLGVVYLGGISALILLNLPLVMALTKAHPLPMSFIKFALLATFGECLKTRIDGGTWFPPKVFLRAFVWGVFGMWISLSFPFIEGGVKQLIAVKEWPAQMLTLSLVMWINFFGGYAFFMMLCHYWVDSMMVERPMWPWKVLGRPEAGRWCKIVVLAIIFFWSPVHLVTFSLPPLWRTLWAAYVSMAFGLILSFAAGRRAKSA